MTQLPVTAEAASIRQLTTALEAGGMGPLASVKVTTDPAADPDRADVIRIELTADAPHKACTLLRWIDLITVWDMVAGQFRASDQALRLHVRGQWPSGGRVIVTVPFDHQTEAAQVALITSTINQQQPCTLITRLAELEAAPR